MLRKHPFAASPGEADAGGYAQSAKRARRAARRKAEAVIDLSEHPFVCIDLRSPQTPRTPRLLLAREPLAAAAEPALSADADDAALLEATDSPAWKAFLDDVKTLMPRVLDAFLRKVENDSGRVVCAAVNADAGARVYPRVRWAPFVGADRVEASSLPWHIHKFRLAVNPSESTLIFAYMYVERLCRQAPGLEVNTYTAQRLLSVALLLAFKFHEDFRYKIKTAFWANCFRIVEPELVALEALALRILGWKLTVSPCEFQAFLEPHRALPQTVLAARSPRAE